MTDIDNMFNDEHMLIGSYLKLFDEENTVVQAFNIMQCTNPTEEYIKDMKIRYKDVIKLTKKAIEQI